MTTRRRRTKAQIERASQAHFDAIKAGVVEGYYETTACSKCGKVKPCVGRTRKAVKCRDCIRG